MAEPENHTFQLLRKMDRDLQEFRGKMGGDLQDIRDTIDRNDKRVHKRLNGLQLALQGKNFDDQCAIACFDQRISALEKRSSRPRKPK